MRRVAWASVVFALCASGCEHAADEPASEDGGSENAGGGGRTPNAGAAGRAAAGQAGTGGSAGGAGRAGAGGFAGSGGSTGVAGSAGVAGSSGAPDQGGAAGAGSAGGAASGGVAGITGGSGGGLAATSGSGADGGNFSAGGNAGAGGEPSDDPSACESPFETVDVSRLDTTQTLDEYAVTGTTANQIRQSIDANRQGDYDAYTSWYLSWQFADCSGGGLVVTADVTYRVPEWDAPDAADPELVTSWQTYKSALFCHEYGHAKLGLDAANEVYAALDAIDAGGDCGSQQSLAQQAFNAILDDYGVRELEYDAETNHGATMGAIFPPP